VGVDQSLDVKQGQLVVIGLTNRAAWREWEIIVIDNHDVRRIDQRQALWPQVGQGKAGFVRAALGQPIRVADLGQVDESDFLQETVGVQLAEVDLVDALELCRPREAVDTRLIWAIEARAFCRIVALDHQAGGRVEHLEVGRDLTGFFKLVLPLAFAVALRGNVEFQNTAVWFAIALSTALVWTSHSDHSNIG